MTTLPDWLVERAALDELTPAQRGRVERVDPDELSRRVAALRDANAAELAAYPAGPAVAQIEARLAAELRRRGERRRRWRLSVLGIVTSVVVVVAIVVVMGATEETRAPALADGDHGDDGTRAKGGPRLAAYRQAGDQIERLEPDALVRPGDVIQLRYSAGGHGYGVIASVDGAGVVTLHYPAREDAPPEAPAVRSEPTSLPHAYSLDDAPRFERFFIITSRSPIDLQRSLTALRAFARRSDSATAPLDLPAGLRQASLRLRKPDRSSNPKSP